MKKPKRRLKKADLVALVAQVAKDLDRQIARAAKRVIAAEEPHNRWTCPGCPHHG